MVLEKLKDRSLWEEYNLPLYTVVWILVTGGTFTLWKRSLSHPHLGVLNGNRYFFVTLVFSILFMRGGTQEKQRLGICPVPMIIWPIKLRKTHFLFCRSYIELQEEESFNTHFNKDVDFSHIHQQIKKLKQESSIPASTYDVEVVTSQYCGHYFRIICV